MSNRLVRLAQRVTVLTIDGADRPIRASEKAVLTTLADDARDASGECAALSLNELARRTSLAKRTVIFALAALVESGLVARDGGPGRRSAVTRIFLSSDSPHKGSGFTTEVNQVHLTGESTAPPSLPVTQYDHMPSAGAREPVDEVDQVFAAWDAMAAAAKLPGCPIERDAAREAAVLRHLRDRRVGQIVAAIHHLGRSKWLTGKRADGQGDFMATFDWVFGVGNRSWARNLLRIIEGEFNRGQRALEEPRSLSPPSDAAAKTGHPPDDPEFAGLRAVLREQLGERGAASWTGPLRFVWRGNELVATAPSSFVADWVTANHRPILEGWARATRGASAAVTIAVAPRRQLAPAGHSP